jgi:acetylornithine deacetylase/succinyl-diaminopimelate desuccinylase-like protein
LTGVSPARVEERVSAAFAASLNDLARLARIPSVPFPGFPTEPLLNAAEATAEILSEAGWGEVELIGLPDGPPVVYGDSGPAERPGPCVLLYAHYDVQPAGDVNEWASDPWEPTERRGRLYGRGTGDDKCGIAMHASTMRAFAGRPPTRLKVLIEGAEEVAGGSLERLIESQPQRFQADVVVLADAGNVRRGEPTLTTSLRGLVGIDVGVRTLAQPVHSGLFGGPAPDALIALVRMLSTLHDDAGGAAVIGLARADWGGRSPEEAEFRSAAGLLDGVRLTGEDSVGDRLFARPAITVIGLDAPRVDGAANLVSSFARCRLSIRLEPSQDPAQAAEAVLAHLSAAAPWGARVSTKVHQLVRGWRDPGGAARAAAESALARAYGRPAVAAGSGGGLPLLETMRKVLPNAQFVLWGPWDERSHLHGTDESIDLGELQRAMLAQVLLVEILSNSDVRDEVA